MAKYRKIDPRIWNDEKFYTASLSCQHLFLFILTHPQMTPVGGMRTTPAGLADELDWKEKKFPDAFPDAMRDGINLGFWKYDRKAKFLLVPKFLKYNPPASINTLKSWRGCWDDLPECQLKNEVFQTLKGMAYGMGDGFRHAFGDAFGDAMPYTGAGTGIKEAVSDETGGKPPDPVKQIFDEGVSLLTDSGMEKADARTLVGQLRKALDDPEALKAIRAAQDKTDPATWLRACCQKPVKLPYDPQSLFAIRKAVGLPFEFDDTKACHEEIHSQLRKHPELRPKVEAVA